MTAAGHTPLEEVVAVLDALEGARCRVWVGGGWGVDALAGRVTRPHRDLDLAVDARDETRVIDALAQLGYAVETDWRPVRVELAAAARGRVDVHPVERDPSGAGVQANLPGRPPFLYPASCFTAGAIGARAVPCLSFDQQLAFHRGYPPRDRDRHDLAVLHEVAASRGRQSAKPSACTP